MSVDDVASTIDNINYRVLVVNATSMTSISELLNKTIQAGSWGIQNSVNIAPYRWSDYLINEFFSYTKGTNNLIASEGSSIHFNLSGIYNRVTAEYNGNYYESYSAPYISKFQVTLYDKSNNVFYNEFLSTNNFSTSTIGGSKLDLIDFKVDNLTSDLYKINVQVYFNPRYNFPLDDTVFNNASSYKLGFGLGDKTMLQVFVDDGQTGLLKGILSGITELPSKIWNLVENGLKGLFVPTEAQMTEVKGQWDTLLSDRFGGLYQTVQLIDDYASTFKEPSASKNSIDFPEFRLNVGSESEFVLQAHDVQIVPDRFSFLVDVVKTIISIIATCLFVNGLRNKFERLVGGQE